MEGQGREKEAGKAAPLDTEERGDKGGQLLEGEGAVSGQKRGEECRHPVWGRGGEGVIVQKSNNC